MKAIYQIVGMRFRGAEALVASLPAGEPLRLVRDADNQHDANAIEVWARGVHVGFVKATEAASLAKAMDRDGKQAISGRFATENRWPAAEVEE